jgi:hypothetical protein
MTTTPSSMPRNDRRIAARVLAWALETGTAVRAGESPDVVILDPHAPSAVAAALDTPAVRLFVLAWMDDAAERWPASWAQGSPIVRTWLASRSCARIAFTAAEHTLHAGRTAHRLTTGATPELADLHAIGDVLRSIAPHRRAA